MDYKFKKGDKVKISEDIADYVIDMLSGKSAAQDIKLSKDKVYEIVAAKNKMDITIKDDTGKEVPIFANYFDKVKGKSSVIDNLHKKQKQEQTKSPATDKNEKSQNFKVR